jgi:hypothetical protein
MPKDIIINGDLDALISSGDFSLGESTAQHQNFLIMAEKGEFKEWPMRGVGARRYLEDHSPERLAREIRQEFSYDGMEVEKISIADDKINVQAHYK